MITNKENIIMNNLPLLSECFLSSMMSESVLERVTIAYNKILCAKSQFQQSTGLKHGEIAILAPNSVSPQYCIPIAQCKSKIILLKGKPNGEFGLKTFLDNHYPCRLISPLPLSFVTAEKLIEFDHLGLITLANLQNQFGETVGAKPGSIVFEVSNNGKITGQLAVLLAVANGSFRPYNAGKLILGGIKKGKIVPFSKIRSSKNWRILQAM